MVFVAQSADALLPLSDERVDECRCVVAVFSATGPNIQNVFDLAAVVEFFCGAEVLGLTSQLLRLQPLEFPSQAAANVTPAGQQI
jgi:hypothetical protein